MSSLSKRDTVLVGLTLFSMFFGAGNLIFPPFLGAQAGTDTWIAMVGFALSAIGLPVLGVVAVACSGGLPQLATRVHPRFAFFFTLLIYLSIGPGLAIPRTASTSYSMAVSPFVSQEPGWLLPLYSAVFFAVALLLALRPDRLTDRLGRVLGPTLLVLIGVMTLGCLFRAPGGYGPAVGSYASLPAVQGFLDGYLTMDTIAALNFGIIISLNIRAKGVTQDRSVVRTTIRAGWIAGGILLLVYAALAHVGAISGGSFPGASNGTQVLTALMGALLGPAGSILLGAVFVLACLNTCVGLLSCCSEYFSTQFPILSYRGWLLLFGVVSFLISIAGLDAILAVSVPILGVIYPVAIMLIVLGLSHRLISSFIWIYPVTICVTTVFSVLSALDQAKLLPSLLSQHLSLLPLFSISLGWVLPSAAAVLVCILLSPRRTAS